MSMLSSVPWGLLVPSGLLVAFSFAGGGNGPPPPATSSRYSWDLLHRHGGVARGPHGTGVIFQDVEQRDSTVIAVAPNGSIRSADGGVTWKDVPAARFLDVALGDSGLVLAGGFNGMLRRSVDDGVTWTEVKTGAEGPLLAVTITGNTAFAIVGNSAIRSVDRGMTWRRSPLPRIWWMDVARAGRVVIAVGGAGMVARSMDGGESWETRWLPGTKLTNGIAFADDHTAVIVGDGIVLRTTDAGLTWNPVPSPSRTPLRSIAFAGALDGLAVGAWGEAIRTADGGATWEREATATRFHLAGVSPRPGGGFLVSGFRETVFAVTAGGAK